MPRGVHGPKDAGVAVREADMNKVAKERDEVEALLRGK